MISLTARSQADTPQLPADASATVALGSGRAWGVSKRRDASGIEEHNHATGEIRGVVEQADLSRPAAGCRAGATRLGVHQWRQDTRHPQGVSVQPQEHRLVFKLP